MKRQLQKVLGIGIGLGLEIESESERERTGRGARGREKGRASVTVTVAADARAGDETGQARAKDESLPREERVPAKEESDPAHAEVKVSRPEETAPPEDEAALNEESVPVHEDSTTPLDDAASDKDSLSWQEEILSVRDEATPPDEPPSAQCEAAPDEGSVPGQYKMSISVQEGEMPSKDEAGLDEGSVPGGGEAVPTLSCEATHPDREESAPRSEDGPREQSSGGPAPVGVVVCPIPAVREPQECSEAALLGSEIAEAVPREAVSAGDGVKRNEDTPAEQPTPDVEELLADMIGAVTNKSF